MDGNMDSEVMWSFALLNIESLGKPEGNAVSVTVLVAEDAQQRVHLHQGWVFLCSNSACKYGAQLWIEGTLEYMPSIYFLLQFSLEI